MGAPGVAPQDIKVSVEGRTLVIEGESKRPGAQRSIRFSTQLPHDADADQAVASSINGLLQVTGETRRTGARVAKRVRLPRDADASAASATHVDGLLTVSVPKKSEAQVKKVLTVESVPAS